MKQYFYTLHVYRLNEEDYNNQRSDYIKKLGINLKNTDKVELFKNIYGGSWQFNEIIGFLKLYFRGSQILGEYWKVDVKRIRKTRRKKFTYIVDKFVPELIEIPFHSTNKEIFSLVCDYTNLCKKEIPKRIIDDTQFLHIGKYINWNELLKSSLERTL